MIPIVSVNVRRMVAGNVTRSAPKDTHVTPPVKLVSVSRIFSFCPQHNTDSYFTHAHPPNPPTPTHKTYIESSLNPYAFSIAFQSALTIVKTATTPCLESVTQAAAILATDSNLKTRHVNVSITALHCYQWSY